MRRLNPFNKPIKKTTRKRKSPRKLWVKQLSIIGICLGLVGGVSGSTYWAIEDGVFTRGWSNTVAFVSEQTVKSGLVVEEVFASNRKSLPSKDLLAALNVNLGDPILFYDVDAAQMRVEKLGWVRLATVERQLPNKIYVNIQERTPVAIWQRDHIFTLVDAEGAMIGQDSVKNYGHLKVVVGENAPKNAADLMRLLAEAPTLEKRVVAAVWIGDKRWNLHLDNGINIRLPEANPVKAWARLAEIQKEHAVLAKDITTIDMRQADRLVVKLTDTGAQKLLEISKKVDHET